MASSRTEKWKPVYQWLVADWKDEWFSRNLRMTEVTAWLTRERDRLPSSLLSMSTAKLTKYAQKICVSIRKSKISETSDLDIREEDFDAADDDAVSSPDMDAETDPRSRSSDAAPVRPSFMRQRIRKSAKVMEMEASKTPEASKASDSEDDEKEYLPMEPSRKPVSSSHPRQWVFTAQKSAGGAIGWAHTSGTDIPQEPSFHRLLQMKQSQILTVMGLDSHQWSILVRRRLNPRDQFDGYFLNPAGKVYRSSLEVARKETRQERVAAIRRRPAGSSAVAPTAGSRLEAEDKAVQSYNFLILLKSRIQSVVDGQLAAPEVTQDSLAPPSIHHWPKRGPMGGDLATPLSSSHGSAGSQVATSHRIRMLPSAQGSTKRAKGSRSQVSTLSWTESEADEVGGSSTQGSGLGTIWMLAARETNCPAPVAPRSQRDEIAMMTGRPGFQWASFFKGWQGIGSQWNAPGVLLSRSFYQSWGATWSAYTSHFAAIPGAHADQGIQKVLDVRFHPTGQPYLISGCNAAPNELILYNLESGKAAHLEGHGHQIQAVEFADNGESIVSCAVNHLKVWDTATASCLHTLGLNQDGHTKKISAMAVNRWDPWLVCSSGAHLDHKLLLWNVRTGQLCVDLNEAARRSHGSSTPPLPTMDTLAFASSSLLLCGSDTIQPVHHAAVIQMWDIHSSCCLFSTPMHSKFISSLSVHPQGHLVATGSGDGTVGFMDIRQKLPVGHLTVGPHVEVTSTSFSHCGAYLQASSVANCSLVWDVRMPPSPFQLADRALHCLGHGEPMPTTENAGNVPGHVDEGDEGVNDARWMHSCPVLVTASGNGSMAMWDVRLGQPCVRAVKAHTRSINTVAVSHDDAAIATGGDDQKIVLYESKFGNQRKHKWRLTHPT